jgi:hypothetical protein
MTSFLHLSAVGLGCFRHQKISSHLRRTHQVVAVEAIEERPIGSTVEEEGC